MEKLLDAFLGAIGNNPLEALVILLIMAIVFLGIACTRLFALYVTVNEKRIEEGNMSREAINLNTRVLERVADILKVTVR